mmetsp:Transcript_14144/g.21223  ORF Transcript_14144/g.21223 Transcript_14144/m.21223 type:complete len:240 (+) Transcript_14144:411-1130(+)
MLAETATAKDSKNGTGESPNSFDSSLDKISLAPRFMVIPQSPSPTIVSYLVRIGSDSISELHAAATARATISISKSSTGTFEKSLIFFLGASTSGSSVAEGRSPCTISAFCQAIASVASSRNSQRCPDLDKETMDTEAPCISNEVIKEPTYRRETAHFPNSSPSKCFTTELASMLISKLLVPPRLFTKMHKSSPSLNVGTIDLLFPSPSSRPKSKIVLIIMEARSSAERRGDFFSPASP